MFDEWHRQKRTHVSQSEMMGTTYVKWKRMDYTIEITKNDDDKIDVEIVSIMFIVLNVK